MKKRAVGYCRISTLMQVDNTSLKDQEDKIRMYAKLHDIVIDEIFIDKAVSGKSTDRPEYDKMMDYVKENVADYLPEVVFDNHYRACEDWEAWEKLSKLKGEFVYIPKMIMGYSRA